MTSIKDVKKQRPLLKSAVFFATLDNLSPLFHVAQRYLSTPYRQDFMWMFACKFMCNEIAGWEDDMLVFRQRCDQPHFFISISPFIPRSFCDTLHCNV